MLGVEFQSFERDFLDDESAPEVPESIDLETEVVVERRAIIIGRNVRDDRQAKVISDSEDRKVPLGNRLLARRQSRISTKAYSWKDEGEMSPSTVDDFSQISTSTPTVKSTTTSLVVTPMSSPTSSKFRSRNSGTCSL